MCIPSLFDMSLAVCLSKKLQSEALLPTTIHNKLSTFEEDSFYKISVDFQNKIEILRDLSGISFVISHPLIDQYLITLDNDLYIRLSMDYYFHKSSDGHPVSTPIIDNIVIFTPAVLDYGELLHTISHLPIWCSPFNEYNMPYSLLKFSKIFKFRSSHDSFDYIVVNESNYLTSCSVCLFSFSEEIEHMLDDFYDMY